MTEDSVDAYRVLLLKAGRVYDKHGGGRPGAFNVFSVLRRETDEVHLHSRFLVALLGYRRLPDGPRKNLADFLCSVGIHHLDPNRSRVDRECDNIDILIRDDSSRHAVVIENKIWAQDQPKQLQKYAKHLKKEGYTPHLLYLTLDGHDPSEDSAGGLEYGCISYRGLRPWLRGCQERACDEPALRESIAQYVHLVSRLTRTDYSEAYMKDLMKLLEEDDSLVLVHDLNKAMIEVGTSQLCKLWKEISRRVQKDIPDLHCRRSKSESKISKAEIEGIRFRNNVLHGLYYILGDGAMLGITVETGWPHVSVGVRCRKEDHCEEHYRFRDLGGGQSNDCWAWFQYAPTPLD
ncbi:MAG: PD-(D/E)XK nuclease family protein, partial [Chloroflexota bacterium]|nr:PD-(D/E)XK nuclease family protein [Chloroflexota bacterium]